MSKNLIVSNQVRLSAWISTSTVKLLKLWTSPGSEHSISVSTITIGPWFIQCNPMLYFATKFLEANIWIIPEIIPAKFGKHWKVKWYVVIIANFVLVLNRTSFLLNLVLDLLKCMLLIVFVVLVHTIFFINTRNYRSYTTCGLRKPPYSSSNAWGRSQWKRVTKGFIPANTTHNQKHSKKTSIKASKKFMLKQDSIILIPLSDTHTSLEGQMYNLTLVITKTLFSIDP